MRRIFLICLTLLFGLAIFWKQFVFASENRTEIIKKIIRSENKLKKYKKGSSYIKVLDSFMSKAKIERLYKINERSAKVLNSKVKLNQKLIDLLEYLKYSTDYRILKHKKVDTKIYKRNAINKWVFITSMFQGTAYTNETYKGEIPVASLDKRNPIIKIEVENPNVGGSQAKVDAQKNLIWTPTDADFATRILKLKVTSKYGGVQELDFPVEVGKKEIVHRIPIDAGEGNYSDPRGDSIIKISKDKPNAPVTGIIVIEKETINSGGGVYGYWVENGSNFKIEILERPIVTGP